MGTLIGKFGPVLASYTFGCVETSDCVPNNRHLREVLIFFFHSKKTAAEADRELQKVYRNAALSERTITGERYRTQLMRLSRALREKRPQYEQRHEKVILRHENAWLDVAKPVKIYLKTLKWEVLPHPSYSLDFEPSDYYLLRSMAHGLADQQFRSYEDIEKWLDSWIASKDEHF